MFSSSLFQVSHRTDGCLIQVNLLLKRTFELTKYWPFKAYEEQRWLVNRVWLYLNFIGMMVSRPNHFIELVVCKQNVDCWHLVVTCVVRVLKARLQLTEPHLHDLDEPLSLLDLIFMPSQAFGSGYVGMNCWFAGLCQK